MLEVQDQTAIRVSFCAGISSWLIGNCLLTEPYFSGISSFPCKYTSPYRRLQPSITLNTSLRIVSLKSHMGVRTSTYQFCENNSVHKRHPIPYKTRNFSHIKCHIIQYKLGKQEAREVFRFLKISTIAHWPHI
jgi:hypothetical protein